MNILIIEPSILLRNKLKKILDNISEKKELYLIDSLESINLKDYENIEVVIMNYKLPVCSGLDSVKRINLTFPDAKIISYLIGDSDESILGDYVIRLIDKELNNIDRILNSKIKAIFTSINKQRYRFAKQDVEEDINEIECIQSSYKYTLDEIKDKKYDLVVITASTGGPKTLESVLNGIKKLKVPIIIVQHMTENFTNFFAKSISSRINLNVAEVKQNQTLDMNNIYLAKGGSHLIVKLNSEKNEKVLYNDIELAPVNYVKPSADVTFSSLTKSYNKNDKILSIILTGIGSDGTNGVIHMKKYFKDMVCITESEKSCVVYGMPKSVNEEGLSDLVVSKEVINNILRGVMD